MKNDEKEKEKVKESTTSVHYQSFSRSKKGVAVQKKASTKNSGKKIKQELMAPEDFLKANLLSNVKSSQGDNTLNLSSYGSDLTFSKFNTISAHKIKSKYLLLVSIIFLSLNFLFIKILLHSHHDIPHSANTITFFSGFFMFFFSIMFIKIDNIDLTRKRNFNKSDIDSLFIRAFLGFLSVYFTVKALQTMRLISTVTLLYLAPIISGFFIMKKNLEKIKENDKLCILAAILIVLVFFIQNFTYTLNEDVDVKDSLEGILFSLLTVLVNSLNNIIDMRVSEEFHSYTLLFSTGLLSIVLSPILMAFSHDHFFMNTRNFVLFLLLGASSFFAIYFNYKMVEASNLLVNSSMHNITILLSYVFTLVIFDEYFTYWDVFASLLSMVINLYMKVRVEESEDLEL